MYNAGSGKGKLIQNLLIAKCQLLTENLGGKEQTVIVARWLDTSFASVSHLILIRVSVMENSNSF